MDCKIQEIPCQSFQLKVQASQRWFQLHDYYKSKNGRGNREEVNQIQAWVHTHRGVDKSTPLILNTAEATKCLALYTEKAKELNGQDYDILKNDVSSKALYDCSNGKPHGTWSLFNGIVNDIEVISEVRATGASSAALKCR